MSLIKWEPISNNLDRFFDDLPVLSLPRMSWDLAVDLFEKNGALVAQMNLPGVAVHDVDIVVEDNTLRISGSRQEERETNEKDFYSKEIKRGSFSRSLRLPKTVDSEKIDASYEDGVLKIIMPVVETATEKKIQIQVKK